jgi:hypothetical protein
LEESVKGTYGLLGPRYTLGESNEAYRALVAGEFARALPVPG